MTLDMIAGLVLAIFVIAQSAWILVFRPDPPATAKTATRTSRQIIAVAGILIGLVNLYILFFTE
ncbi:MAG: hypothetical protein HOP95_10540 [Sphingomonas sp.]|nr:hypothetical protein [Sphingomonas sp.]